MARRSYNGGAVPTTVTAQVNPTDVSISIAAATNWPTGGGSGEFVCTLNPGLPNEERILVQSRTGTTLTLANTSKRGVDGTSAATHPVNSVIIHGDAAFEADEANRHINDPAQAVTEHSTLLDATRHSAISHTAAMIGTDQVGTDEIAPNAVTGTEIANLAVTAAKIANNTITATQIANDTITGTQIATNAITSAELADNAVDTAAIADLAVTAAKIANDTITATQLAANSVGSSELANNAVDTAAILDAAVTLAKFASEASTDYGGSISSFSTGAFSLGTGGTKYGHYFKLGRVVVGWAGFNMAPDGNLSGNLQVTLPVAMRSASDGFRGFGAGRARDAGTASVFSGTGVIVDSTSLLVNITTAGASAQWDATTPFNWGAGGSGGAAQFDCVFFYEAAA